LLCIFDSLILFLPPSGGDLFLDLIIQEVSEAEVIVVALNSSVSYALHLSKVCIHTVCWISKKKSKSSISSNSSMRLAVKVEG
jgi:hypothetical protein